MALVLGIESSCDETAAAVVRDGEEVLSSVVASQFTAHQLYGGVVPELAAREHLRAIVPVVRKALADAGIHIRALDAVAVTQGPGLSGALLVGISYAKAVAFAAKKPLIAVNHLEGHIHAVLMEERSRSSRNLQFPVLALVVSGGHTHLYLCEQSEKSWIYRNVGRTRDDAAGEAFDKVAKLLGFGYPGGPVIDALAKHGNPAAVRFTTVQLTRTPRNVSKKQPARAPHEAHFDFSYSGIKTAVLRYTQTHDLKAGIEARKQLSKTKPCIEGLLKATDKQTLDLIASFQSAMVQDLVAKTMEAAAQTGAQTLIVTGGVAANTQLRVAFERAGAQGGMVVLFPSRQMSTDNAAMIAAAAYPKLLTGDLAQGDFSAEANLALG